MIALVPGRPALNRCAWLLVSITASAAAQVSATATCDLAPERLRNGDIAVREQTSASAHGIALRVCGEVGAPPATVWSILRDCDRFDEFMPGVAESRLTKREDNVVLCDEVIDLPFPLIDLESLTRVVEASFPDGGFERRWSLVRGSYQRLEGAWTILPATGTAERSVVIYDVDMEPDTLIPDFLIRYAQSIAAPKVFNSVRERVRQCADDAACRRK
jgi:ribosome-associated toxin RatA of RatAB toxin-antitoxin module